MANVVGFDAVRGLEVRLTGGSRFFDIQVEKVIQTASGPATRLVNTELKNLAANAPFRFANQVLKDVQGALSTAGFAPGRLGNIAILERELQSLEYVLRGNPQQMQQVVLGIRATVNRALGQRGLQRFANNVRITSLGRGLPF